MPEEDEAGMGMVKVALFQSKGESWGSQMGREVPMASTSEVEEAEETEVAETMEAREARKRRRGRVKNILEVRMVGLRGV